MIKIYGNTYYMTCGEACYIAKADGELMHVCFGKRIEPEDDASLLGGSATSAYKEVDDDDIAVYRGNKRITPRFVVGGAEIVEKTAVSVLPTLRGEETLKVTATDEAEGLELTLFYTPYIRGGVARRAVLKNVSDKSVTLKRLSSGGAATGGGKKLDLSDGLTVVKTTVGVYGIFTLFAGDTRTSVSDGRLSSGAEICATELKSGESFFTPETLLVYSDNGAHGVVRAYHDIIREYGVSESRLLKRRPIVVYAPFDGGAEKNRKRMEAVAATGADTVVFDVSCGVKKAKELKAAADGVGIKIGIKCGVSHYDELLSVVDACGAEYVELDCEGLKTYDDAAIAHALYLSLKDNYPDVEIDFAGSKSEGGAFDRLKRVSLSPIPPCAARYVVDSEAMPLKTAFDVASFGGLGYRFDPLELGEGARRAVRAQILSYQDDAETVKLGDVYDIVGGIMVVGKDKAKAYAATTGEARFYGLDEHNLYHVREIGKTFSGVALAYYGFSADGGETVTYHIRQVADYE
ncbi:MAG: alpha-galactosidase [Clostridiales bacterium]|nr:alpha-galactosidase [Clostridiales bacterium]